MSEVWIENRGQKWSGYWAETLGGTWEYLVHHEGADTDMGDLLFRELESMFGPVCREGVESIFTRGYLRRSSNDEP